MRGSRTPRFKDTLGDKIDRADNRDRPGIPDAPDVEHQLSRLDIEPGGYPRIGRDILDGYDFGFGVQSIVGQHLSGALQMGDVIFVVNRVRDEIAPDAMPGADDVFLFQQL